MKKSIIIVVVLSFTMFSSFAQQFDLTAELRPRFENRHGFQSLIAEDEDGSNFVSQRTRLNFGFSKEKLRVYVSMQNIRVWGDVSTLANDDKASALHQAWAELDLNTKIALKFGRQEIAYDDHRIFGNVGWAQQARSHDAFLFKYKPNAKHRFDVGLALNSDSQSNLDNLYSNAAGYKTFQYAWYHGNFDKLGLSVLVLNTGIEYLENEGLEDEKQTIDYMQTIGPRLTFKSGKLKADAAIYFQSGKSLDTDVNSLYYSINFGYKITDEFSAGLGYEYLSGKDMDDSDAKIKSFAPLFGTNHKFNGLMDYFYVGNHGGSVGLSDIYATISYKKDKFSAKLMPHLFSAAANVFEGTSKKDNGLGTEIDLTLGYKISNDVSLNAGYSQMFGTESLELLKGGDKGEHNSWAWIMITVKPKLFSHTVKQVVEN